MQLFSQVGLYWRTARHLRLPQIFGDAYRPIQRKLERPERLLARPVPPFISSGKHVPHAELGAPVPDHDLSRLLAGQFRFLNQEVQLGLQPDWDSEKVPSLLWRYNLHYFDWLWALIGTGDSNWTPAVQAVGKWIVDCPLKSGAVGWESYPLSLRVINWTLLFFVVHRERTLKDTELSQRLWTSLWRQAEWLSMRFETRNQANHLLENVAALALMGSVFEGRFAERWRRISKVFLSSEVEEQVPADGMHYEASPMYHLRVLWLMEVLAKLGDEEIASIAACCLLRMRHALARLRHPDREIALFNDAAFGIYRDAWLDTKEPVGAFALADAGYYGFRNDMGDYIVADAGKIGPDYQPAHAHADFLSFELSLNGRRVITDTGVHDYNATATRAHARSTAAHNTVEINGTNSCEVWAVFRVGRRPKPRVLRWEPSGEGFILEAEHDGYIHLPSRSVHRRRFEWRQDSLRIDDIVEGCEPQSMIGRLHFAPGVEVSVSGSVARCSAGDTRFEVVTDGPGTMRLSESDYYPEFNRVLLRPVLEYQVGGLSRAAWSTSIKRC